jgi:hypothetical protein
MSQIFRESQNWTPLGYILPKMLLHSLRLVLQICEGRDDQLNRPGPMA